VTGTKFFSVKNKLSLSLAAALILISASLLLRNILHLEWNLNITAGTPRYFLFGLAFILAADIVINFVLVLLFQSEYIRLWMEMAGYFGPQRWCAVLGGGLLSASEEVFFRGVLIQCMIQTEAIAAVYAILSSAAAFGLFHIMINRRLALSPYGLSGKDWSSEESTYIPALFLQ
jgi:membrane protease YdiL (CAAX protease family)